MSQISNQPFPKFSPFPTGLCIFLLLILFALISLAYYAVPPLARISSPERSLALIAARTMEFQEARRQAPSWERKFYKAYDAISGSPDEVSQIIDWYEELAAFTKNPVAQIHLAILEGETGRFDSLRKRIGEWKKQRKPLPAFIGLIKTAYLGGRTSENPQRAKAYLQETLPSDWFRERLMVRLVEQTNGPPQRVYRDLWEYRWLILLDLILFLFGGLALLLFLKHRRRDFQAGEASIPPPWPLSTGLTVLIRGAAIGVTGGFLLILFGRDHPMVTLVAYLAIILPLLFLSYRHLFIPAGLNPFRALGFSVQPKKWCLIGLIALAGMEIDSLGSWLLNFGGNLLHLSSHWTETFDTDLVWGNLLTSTCLLGEYVILAPILEEMVFRGLLFGTLRRKFNWVFSGILSAGVFSLAHGYSLLGFCTVFWSGVVWAWSYEKTRSLIPGIVGHMVNNLLYAGTQLLIF